MNLKVIVCSILCLVPAYADGDYEDHAEQPALGASDNVKEGSPSHKWVNLSGNFQLVSDYVYRGQTQTYGGPAAQGGFVLRQKKDEGVYVGISGSNVSGIGIAANGAGLELDLYGGYIYKKDNDLSLGIELRNTRYPGARASLPLKDKFDYLEIIPKVTYKIFSGFFAYSLSDRRGVNQNFASTFPAPLKPNGNSKGSCYAEVNANMPVSFIHDNLKFKVLCGYWYTRNYTKLNYTVFGVGLKYKMPQNWGGVSIFANASATTANKKYFRVTNTSTGQAKNTVGPKVWLGICKKF